MSFHIRAPADRQCGVGTGTGVLVSFEDTIMQLCHWPYLDGLPIIWAESSHKSLKAKIKSLRQKKIRIPAGPRRDFRRDSGDRMTMKKAGALHDRPAPEHIGLQLR
jgi:hypothetical protein